MALPINIEELIHGQSIEWDQLIVARDYRNRRIGDFLKELHLTEGRGTGVPKIYRALERNGSPIPVLETDPDCNYFLTVIYAHPEAKSIEASNQASDQDEIQNINSLEDINDLLNYLTNQVTDQVTDQVKNLVSEKFGDRTEHILSFIAEIPRRRKEILVDFLGLTVQTFNKQRYLNPLLDQNWIELTVKDNSKNRNQKYQLTEKGRLLVKILKK